MFTQQGHHLCIDDKENNLNGKCRKLSHRFTEGRFEGKLEYMTSLLNKVSRENKLLFRFSDEQIRRVKELEETNSRLEEIVAEKTEETVTHKMRVGKRKKLSFSSIARKIRIPSVMKSIKRLSPRKRRNIHPKPPVIIKNKSKSAPSTPMKRERPIDKERTRMSTSLPSSPVKNDSLNSCDSCGSHGFHIDCLTCLRSKMVMKRFVADTEDRMFCLENEVNSPLHALHLVKLEKSKKGKDDKQYLAKKCLIHEDRIRKLEYFFSEFLFTFENKIAEACENFEISQ